MNTVKRLELYTQKGLKRLRMGYTTGSCAAATAKAAAEMLLGGGEISCVRIETPAGVPLELEVEQVSLGEFSASCAIQKDGGDDPDVTHGLYIQATVTKTEEDIVIEGGDGVGRVTKPGLPRPVGEAAINPVPLAMIRKELEETCLRYGYSGGLQAVVSVPEGERTALKTFNPRLGIVGGISILGTTGLVEPMSEKALVDTIRAEIRSRRAQGEQILLLTPGNYGRDFARERYGVPLDRGVKCSNFIGEALDIAVAEGFREILLMGHAGKLVKLAAGIMNTHSRVADGRMEILAAHAGLLGLSPERIRELMDCVSVDAADEKLTAWSVAEELWKSVGERIGFHLEGRAGEGIVVAFCVFAARGEVLASPGFSKMVKRYLEQIEAEEGER